MNSNLNIEQVANFKIVDSKCCLLLTNIVNNVFIACGIDDAYDLIDIIRKLPESIINYRFSAAKLRYIFIDYNIVKYFTTRTIKL